MKRHQSYVVRAASRRLARGGEAVYAMRVAQREWKLWVSRAVRSPGTSRISMISTFCVRRMPPGEGGGATESDPSTARLSTVDASGCSGRRELPTGHRCAAVDLTEVANQARNPSGASAPCVEEGGTTAARRLDSCKPHRPNICTGWHYGWAPRAVKLTQDRQVPELLQAGHMPVCRWLSPHTNMLTGLSLVV